MQVRYNIMNITSLMAFASLKGSCRQDLKDVYFIRCIGSCPQYVDDIKAVDRMLQEREAAGNGYYIRCGQLPALTEPVHISQYRDIYEAWNNRGRTMLEIGNGRYHHCLKTAVPTALNEVSEWFGRITAGVSDSMRQNFLIKMIYWLDCSAGVFFEHWNEQASYKFIYYGSLKKQEYLFLYLLTRLGIDVMILHPAGDLKLDEQLLALSAELRLPDSEPVVIPAYEKQTFVKPDPAPKTAAQPKLVIPARPVKAAPGQAPLPPSKQAVPINVRRPERDRRTESAAVPAFAGGRAERSFEELAQLATSIVMIEVHNKQRQPIGAGSGIMIGSQGYLLTNCHVIRGGALFGVRIEDDTEIYQTDEVIKYNQDLDLALLRIDRSLKPIALYRDAQPLARGQKVVAIGSPLGLFNSVSDGIISGFREFNHVQMIQFTAPISPGSSGGAVLNMYGELIGISTSGFDGGQNINLAVSYKEIQRFAGAFL